MQTKDSFAVTEEFNGMRIDFALKKMRIVSGIRPARRLIGEYRCLVNGKPIMPHYRVKTNDIFQIISRPDFSDNPEPALIKDTSSFLFYYKPARIHTTQLSGTDNFSVEKWLKNNGQPSASLLQRLDYNTSGIITCAKNDEAAKLFRNYEKEGLCDKFYLCLLDNTPLKPFTAFLNLDTKNRKKTKLTGKHADFIRHTQFFPLPEFNYNASTWCICKIKRGARHQIRSHAASCGYPLSGDSVYGQSTERFFLWNFLLSFPGFFIKSPIDTLPPKSLLDSLFIISANWDQFF